MTAATPDPGRLDPGRLDPGRLVLAGEDPPADREAWRELARAVLVKAGADADVDPETALARTDLDGITVAPLYLREDDPGVPAVTRAPGTWDVRVRHDDPDPGRANAAILADLEGGATSLWLAVGDGALAPDDLPRALDGVLLDLIRVVLDPSPDAALAAAQALLLDDRVDRSRGLSGSLGFDRVAAAFRRGERAAPHRIAGHQGVREAAARFPGLQLVTVDGTAYADAGAADADEIAVATATAVGYLRELERAGLDTADAFGLVEFRFAVTDRQFPSIAKLRAARRVWARVAELSGAPAVPQVQHAVTAASMFSTRDPWVNMLRATVGAFAAATGGADAVTVLPFDAAVGRPGAFSRRIARNVQAILHDEASLARVLDPAAGSWYVESLTDRLAERAWERFTAIERAGGVFDALRNGLVGEWVAAAATERERRIATRRMPLTGVSEFPWLDEPALDLPPARDVPGLQRWAEPFEAFRDRSDAVLADTGARPAVQLLVLGASPAASGRVGFATNLLQAGGLGVEVVDDPAACTGPVVCLCAPDPVYREQAPAAAAAAREAGARQVWLAGRIEVPGVDGQLFAGCDALAVLSRVWDVLGAEVAA